ncbi:hemolysin family protein [Polymorphobacter fuscus]|uniref:CBS domain-containing protein n=1 Tax=Sandarakinorhabdus fusca TaxID=1439888 RepID=A0A7C9KNW5_9SPHN|nr:hemolysin family protein [Polymorphobacter fuscus]KAB7645613.1 HlyC/CorC family transporter [Polymorphobacter fuscus]MQT18064.1 CBS domain-containing protein [Polymorphobacter fuscus]NJC08697.1 CBS domain containing-hemolysin-like protein [Polymorphobacter fuscus]
MPDPDSSSDFASRLWRSLRLLITGSDHEPSLRESLEEAIDEHHDSETGQDDLSAVERAMLKNMLHFGERQAGDIGVPRSDMVVFNVDDGFPALVALFREAGHSRMPVFRGDRDHIIGMAHIKDIYAHIAETFDDAVSSARFADLPVEPLLRPVLFVPASMRIIDLLARMRAGRTHMAIIVDEYGGTDGLVTIEDLVEEIVGDIEDEHDEDEAALLQAINDRLWEADARIPLDDLEEQLGTSFANEEIGDEVDTLGGMVFMLAGRVPALGETVDHPSGWRFEVIDGDPRMVRRLRLHAPVAA